MTKTLSMRLSTSGWLVIILGWFSIEFWGGVTECVLRSYHVYSSCFVVEVCLALSLQVVDKLLEMYFTLSSGRHQDDRAEAADDEMTRFITFPGSRALSTRDLLRWCHRISADFSLVGEGNEIAVFQVNGTWTLW